MTKSLIGRRVYITYEFRQKQGTIIKERECEHVGIQYVCPQRECYKRFMTVITDDFRIHGEYCTFKTRFHNEKSNREEG